MDAASAAALTFDSKMDAAGAAALIFDPKMDSAGVAALIFDSRMCAAGVAVLLFDSKMSGVLDDRYFIGAPETIAERVFTPAWLRVEMLARSA
jgi:hypothetical protein